MVRVFIFVIEVSIVTIGEADGMIGGSITVIRISIIIADLFVVRVSIYAFNT